MWAWIACEMYTNKGTVQSWAERAMARYGFEMARTLLPEQLEEDPTTSEYKLVDSDYFDQISEGEHRE